MYWFLTGIINELIAVCSEGLFIVMDAYSYCQIQYNKAYNYVYPIFMDNEVVQIVTSFTQDENKIEFVKDGNIVHTSTREKSNEYTEEFDFCVDTTDIIHQVVHKNIPKNFESYQHSNVRFILTEFQFRGDSLKINFTTNNYNYAVVDRVIDHNFLLYFIRKHYFEEFFAAFSIGLDSIIDNYTLKIIDNNVNIIEMKPHESLIFSKDTYEITCSNNKKDM
jgi:hypothetical protein